MTELVVSAGILLVLVFIGYRTRLPVVTQFLLAGVLGGPHALGLVRDPDVMVGMVELGALLLFFLAGTQFRVTRLAQMPHLISAGAVQVGLTIMVTVLAVLCFHVGWPVALFTGLLVALGSTVLSDVQPAAHVGRRTAAGVTLQHLLRFQSALVVPLLLLIPVIGQAEGTFEELVKSFEELVKSFFVCVTFITIILIFAQRRIPRWLSRVAGRQGREGVLAAVLGLCASLALVAHLVGLGLAIGAFFAGQMLSMSRYCGRAIGEVLPLRVIFGALFFVPLGMLVDLPLLVEQPLLVLAVAGGVLLCKVLIAAGSMALLGVTAGTAAGVSLALTPFGEFAFLLLYTGQDMGLAPAGLGAEGGPLFIAVGALLYVVAPLVDRAQPALRRGLQWMGFPEHASGELDHRRYLPAPSPREAALGTRTAYQRLQLPEQEIRSLLCTCAGRCGCARSEPFVVLPGAGRNAPRIRIAVVEAGAPAVGFSLGELALWRRLGVVPLAVWRRDVCLARPSDDLRLGPGDRVVLSACPERLALSMYLFETSPFGVP